LFSPSFSSFASSFRSPSHYLCLIQSLILYPFFHSVFLFALHASPTILSHAHRFASRTGTSDIHPTRVISPSRMLQLLQCRLPCNAAYKHMCFVRPSRASLPLRLLFQVVDEKGASMRTRPP
jgi:hypothetical protein